MKSLSVIESIFITIGIISFVIGISLLTASNFLNQEKDKEKIKAFTIFWWISLGIFVLVVIYIGILTYLLNRK